MDYFFHILAGWWFQTFFGIFHHIWDVILPIDELIFFQMVIAPPTTWEFHHPNSLSLIFFKGVGRLKPPTSPLSRLRQWKGWGGPSPTGCYFERSTVATGREVVAAGKPRALDENRVIWWTWNWYLTSQMLLLDREDDGKWWFKHIWICLILWAVYFQMNPLYFASNNPMEATGNNNPPWGTWVYIE